MDPKKQTPDMNKSDKSSISYKAGDKIERFGDKLEDKGYTKTGEAVHKFGDKIEHLQDKKAGAPEAKSA